MSLTFFIHVYYPGSWKLIAGKCGHLFKEATRLIVSACHDEVIKEIRTLNPEAVILKVTNKGKDIGGKLASLSYYYNFCEPTTYFAFLHDKISPQTLNAEYWFNQLYDIFSVEKFAVIMDLLASKKNVGIAGSKAFLKNEYSKSKKQFDTTNNEILFELMNTYALNPETYDYIGGTIFVARSDAMSGFFKEHRPLQIRQKLEGGNVLDLEHGTYTHSWERLLCFIPQANGYKLAGV
ncbi:rhamnan synthesis F family protein [Flavitalea antarctica]